MDAQTDDVLKCARDYAKALRDYLEALNEPEDFALRLETGRFLRQTEEFISREERKCSAISRNSGT